jgi:hypothetical protein
MTHTEEQHSGVDPDLVGLVQLADAYGLEYHLVLTLPGQVVEGTLIGGRAFAEEVAGLVQGEDPEGTLRHALAGRFRQRVHDLGDWGAASKLGDLDPESPDSEDLPALPDVEFVHLRDASASGAPDRQLPLWRGRLDLVAGWTLSD